MGKYDKYIDTKRPIDEDHIPMPMHNRASQFAPFNALTGFGGRIHEDSRTTQARIYLADEQMLEINNQLRKIQEQIKEKPIITITYFVPDKTKDGGEYVTITGAVKRIDEYEKCICLEKNVKIAFNDLLRIER